MLCEDERERRETYGGERASICDERGEETSDWTRDELHWASTVGVGRPRCEQLLEGSGQGLASAVSSGGSAGMDGKWTSGELKETAGNVGRPASSGWTGGHTASSGWRDRPTTPRAAAGAAVGGHAASRGWARGGHATTKFVANFA
ncbi:hypothetical protein NL676_025010 [Syzygium grande]|nr:hypothetical protein NL676_025010 [Syzygium grande]